MSFILKINQNWHCFLVLATTHLITISNPLGFYPSHHVLTVPISYTLYAIQIIAYVCVKPGSIKHINCIMLFSVSHYIYSGLYNRSYIATILFSYIRWIQSHGSHLTGVETLTHFNMKIRSMSCSHILTTLNPSVLISQLHMHVYIYKQCISIHTYPYSTVRTYPYSTVSP